MIKIELETNNSFNKCACKIKKNNFLYNEFCKRANKIIKENITFKAKFFDFLDFRIAKKKILNYKPNLDMMINIHIFYTTPKKRNKYSKNYELRFNDIKNFICDFDEIKKNKNEEEIARIKRQEEIAKERALLTVSLRYDILKRDNFRCQICGSTQADGVKLHVDHIIPVSKGGKTVPENLQTLCDRCNLGKSNKM